MWECAVKEVFQEPAPYCCESAGESLRCCQTSTAVFTLQVASMGMAQEIQTFPGSSAATTTSVSLPPTTPTSPTETNPPASTRSPAATQAPLGATSEDSQMSTGAKAGIAVGASALVLLLAAVGILLWKRKKSEAKLAGGPVPIEMPPNYSRRGYPQQGFYHGYQKADQDPSEMDTMPTVSEVYTPRPGAYSGGAPPPEPPSQPAVELPTTSHQYVQGK